MYLVLSITLFVYSVDWHKTSACHAVRSIVEFASRLACAVCRSVDVDHRRLLLPAVRWRTNFLDLAYFEVAVVARPGGLASVSSTVSAVAEVYYY